MKTLLLFFLILPWLPAALAIPDIEHPKPLSTPLANLSPEGAAKNPAEVTVLFIVDPSGITRNAIVTHSTRRSVETPAVEIVSTWRFSPATRAGKQVSARMKVTLKFAPDRIEIVKIEPS